MQRLRFLAILITLTLTAGLPLRAENTAKTFVPVTDTMLRNPDPGHWLMWRRTLDSWGYSPLDEINQDNVAEMTLAWSRGMPKARGNCCQEGTPLVYDGIMYVPSQGDVIQALDAVTGDWIWEYQRPSLPDDLLDYYPTGETNRNIAIYDDLIISLSADVYIFALNARTGELVWETQILDYKRNAAQQTSGPIIANGKIISGRGCEPEGGPQACIVTAHDPATGEELWRTNTIQSPGDGEDSWGGVPYEERWHVGTWMVPSYDPELNLIYIGTSVTSPAPKFMFGSNDHTYLYHNSTLALDADSGEIVWYYQHVVDHWDLDHPFERLLLDTAVAPDPGAVRWINPRLKSGERRKVVTGIPGKTGIVYTLDRTTGEFLWATETIKQNVVADIDGSTGTVRVNPEMKFTKAGDRLLVCPSTSGGKSWAAGAYSPRTNVMYFPLQNTCMNATAIADKPSLDSLYALNVRALITPGTENLGTVHAISAETGKTMWKYEQRAGTLSLVATGGGLIFGGDNNGRFRAFDDTSGKVLWEINIGSEVTGYPISYAVDGRQYIAVNTGTSQLSGSYAYMTPETRPSGVASLYVFTLPQ